MTKTNTIGKIFHIIDYIINCQSPPTLTDMQKNLDIPKSSLYVMLQELCALDILAYRDDKRVYYVGTKLIKQSSNCLSKVDLPKELRFVATSLSKKLHCSVSAGVLDGRNVTYIFESAGATHQPTIKSMGLVVPAHICSIGKILLSGLTNEQIRELYKGVEFEVFTERSISNIDVLLADIDRVRVQGYATEVGEFSPFISCVSHPIIIDNKYVAGISISMAVSRMTPETIENNVMELQKACLDVLERLGVIEE